MSSPEMSTLTPLTRSMAAVASSRSDSLTRNSCRPRMMVVPSAKAAATASTRYSSIIDAAQFRGADPGLRHRFAGIAPNLAFLDRRAHFAQRREQPGAQRIGHDV